MCYSFKVFGNLTVHKVFVIEYAKLISICLAGSEYATVPSQDTGGFLRRRILTIGLSRNSKDVTVCPNCLQFMQSLLLSA
jgi:hypothetical protein